MHCTLHSLAALTRQDTAVVADDVRIYAEFLHAIEQVQSTLPLLTLFQRTDSSIEADNIRMNFLFRHTREQMYCLLPLAGFLQQTDRRVVADFIGLDVFQWHFSKQVQSLLATQKTLKTKHIKRDGHISTEISQPHLKTKVGHVLWEHLYFVNLTQSKTKFKKHNIYIHNIKRKPYTGQRSWLYEVVVSSVWWKLW